MKKKFYAVAVGRECGIFTDWGEVEALVKGFPGAKYQSFSREEEAHAWLSDPVYKKSVKPAQGDVSVSIGQERKRHGIVVFTDGCSLNNPGPGGFGIVIEKDGQVLEVNGGFRHTTNNRMEMMGAVVALQKLKGCNKKVDLYSDSSYLVNGIAKGWAKKWQGNGWRKADGQEVMNIDLWQKLLEIMVEVDVCFHWVRGHAGNPANERCDRLAVSAAQQPDLAIDQAYEDGNGERTF